MLALVRFLFVFFLGWMGAIWIYDVQFPVGSLQDSINNKVENIVQLIKKSGVKNV